VPETFEQKVKKASRGKKVVMVSMPRPDVVDDVLWGQLHKLARQLNDAMADFSPGQILYDDSRHVVRIALILKTDKLPPKMLVMGPPLGMKTHIAKFRKSHGKARFVKKGGKLYAEVKRPLTKADAVVMQFFRHYSKTDSHLAYPEEMIVIG
jgi:tRNA nucleotidyltransferase (CCA-adding enzyme)